MTPTTAAAPAPTAPPPADEPRIGAPDGTGAAGLDETRLRVLVIGAGMSGVAAAIRLKRAGIEDFVVLEQADRVGGTWRENTYPGCGCDVPSALYSYSFAPSSEWTRLFAGQPEIQAYIEDTVRREGIADHLRLGTEALDAAWDERQRRWVVETSAGRYVARVAIFAAGPITEPQIPDLPGLDRFEGEVFHSGRWNHDVDLTGRRVAVVGTGASAIQFVPHIQPRVGRLHLFQRTAPWVVPKPDLAIPAPARALFRRVPLAQRAVRDTIDLILEAITFGMRHPRLLRQVQRLMVLHLRRQVPDPELRAALTPEFVLGCKRLLLANDYYPALRADNVEVVPHAVVEVGQRHVVAANGDRREVDVIVFGTGFDVSHPPVAERARGRGGRTLADAWQGSPQAYLGTTVNGAPNAFIMLGPNLLVYSSFVALAEAQLDYVVDAIERMEHQGIEVLEVRADVQRSHNDELQRALGPTVWNSGGCRSYYLDAAGRNFACWPWTIAALRRRLRRIDLADYEVVRSEANVAHV